MNNKVVVGIVVVVLVLLGALVFGSKSSNTVVTDNEPSPGSVPGGDIFQPVDFFDSVVFSGAVSTTSQGNVTVTAAEFRKWVGSSLVSFSPGLLAGATITLPASSTIASVVPRPGDRAQFCMQNSTSTLLVNLNIAGGVGTKLLVASSTATALGSARIETGKIGCFTLIREMASTSAYDIDVLLDVWR